MLAFALSAHPRCGAQSAARVLPVAVMQYLLLHCPSTTTRVVCTDCNELYAVPDVDGVMRAVRVPVPHGQPGVVG